MGPVYAAAKKPFRTILGSEACIVSVHVFEAFGNVAFEVSIDPAPKLDPSAPSFTARQCQFLAYILNYTKIHGQAPSDATGSNTSASPLHRFTKWSRRYTAMVWSTEHQGRRVPFAFL